ncbi:MAG TPA: tetratricopeptide repeat protein [Chloroflexota bacterium]|jgi:tetratricopeptide (TPR) repeat protein|nr:tetratricopeptide repeat protein [Chloroflexota bacterium]
MLSKLGLAAITLALAVLFAVGHEVGRAGLAGYLQANPAPPMVGTGATLRQRLEGIAPVQPKTDEGAALRDRGLDALRQARATADPTRYRQAERALNRALELRPNDPDVLVGLGTLALARHQFADALAWGERAKAVAPKRAAAHGVIGDALVELGRYEEAFDAVQTMVDLRPDLPSYTRVSYVRELQGDLDGAVQAMRLAVDAGGGAGEAVAWARVQLGHLLLQRGDVAGAEREYRWARAADPGNMAALAGLGRARLTAGDPEAAIPYYARAVERYPLPELVLTLGDLYEAVGRTEDAARQFELARTLQTLVAANGGNVDLELALFEAERGDAGRAVELARAELARRPSIHAHDALAWALHNAGDDAAAREASLRARRLGTRDGLMLFHAGMIELKLGDHAAARALLAEALAANPGFSARWAPEARRLLEVLR